MVLLTVVAVGLLSLSSISLRSSGKEAAMATARANARMAMMLALGELQKHAGPDQRVTARKDLAGGTDNPLYTGVWDSKPDPLAPNAPLDKTTPLAWLVSGNNTVGLPTTPLVSAANGGTEVRAPIQEVQSTAASAATGGYAYWVGDEGVKARINLNSPGYGTAATATDAAYAFAGAPRSAIEQMEAWGDGLYPYTAETADKLLTTGQLPLYAPADKLNAAQAAAKARFHDLTAYSASVLSNTADGGLRQDLSRVLSDPSKPGPADSDPIFPAVDPSPHPPSPTAIQSFPPTWGRFREWWNNPVDPATGALTPTLRTTSTPSIAPVVMWADLGLAFFAEDLSTATPPGVGYRLRVQAFPRAIIWNPYTAPMAGGTYELGFSAFSPSGGASVAVKLENTTGTPIGSYYFNKYSFSSTASSRYLRFDVTVPQLEPGQARVFSLGAIGSSELQAGDYPGNYTILNASSADYVDTTVEPPYRLSIPNTPNFGGGFSFYLRAAGEADPGTVKDETLPSKIYQWAARHGINQQGISGYSVPPSVPSGSPPPPSLVSLPIAGSTATQRHLSIMNTPGMRGAWIRWMANGNQMAPILIRHTADTTASPFYGSGIVSPSYISLPSTPSGEVSVSTHLSSTMNGSQAFRLTLREPRLPDDGLYQSIAHLQHAPLSDAGIGPLNAVGNSLQNPRIPDRAASFIKDGTWNQNRLQSPFYDSSFLLNQALWDKYFFSTVPPNLTDTDLAQPGYKLPNSRLDPLASASSAKLLKHDTAAAGLMLQGGFNINSTSEQAWRAMLAAAQNLKYDPVTGFLAPSNPLVNPFSRFLEPRGDFNDRYRGFRQLNETQIAALAANIVTEVRTRGPFRSLADFVNRRLVAKTDAVSATGLKGAVQAAIDAADWDSTAAKQINTQSPYNANITGIWGGGTIMDWEAWLGIPKVGTNNPVAKSPTSSRNSFGPGYLSQADVLSRIGSAISARSDTFVIRTYGEAKNGNTVTAKAYCEAVVQRTPDYVDPTTAPEAVPATGSINERFGRRFTVVSFRWLSPNEI